MHTQNIFFRSLLIAGLTSYEKLTKSGKYIPLLIDQCDTMAEELDASPHGVLYDYPRECYPIDVFAVVAWIKKADEVTGKDHSGFFKRELRAFQFPYLDKHGLIPWMEEPETGKQIGESRGIINSHVLTFARDLYPEQAKKWYKIYEKHFWQKKWFGEGWREFYREHPDGEWTFDIDAGPVIGGFSPAANAFGFAAAEKNGRLDHAYTLGSQVIASSWPLPDGTLLGGRILSDSQHAPYLGETGILWQLTVTPDPDVKITKGGHWGGAVWIAFMLYFGTSLTVFTALFFKIRGFRKKNNSGMINCKNIKPQFMIWISLFVIAVIASFFNIITGLILLLAMNLLPKINKVLRD